MYQEMTSSVLNVDIMVQNRTFWTIEEHLYFVYDTIILYQRIKLYRIETIDIGRFRWNNGVSGKCNPSKYYGIYCTG